jgi:hypothetical protein
MGICCANKKGLSMESFLFGAMAGEGQGLLASALIGTRLAPLKRVCQ